MLEVTDTKNMKFVEERNHYDIRTERIHFLGWAVDGLVM